jgi:hypothetical protein
MPTTKTTQPGERIGLSPATKLILVGLAITAASGWGVAWRLFAEREALAARLPQPTAGAVARPSAGPEVARLEQRAGLASVIKDKQTLDFLEEIPDILAGAMVGVPNERYLAAARKVLFDSNKERRTLHFSLLLQNLRPEDASSLHEMFLASHREGRPLEEYRDFAVRWGVVDGKGAMEYYKSTPDSKIQPWDVETIMSGWGQTAPLEAMRWVATNPDVSNAAAPANGVLQGWSHAEPEAATAWLLANSTSPATTAQGLSDILQRQLFGKGVRHAGKWLASLPDDDATNLASRQSWRAVQDRLDRLSNEEAGELWKSVGQKSWMGWNEFEAFSRNMAKANEGSDAGFLALAGNGDPAGISNKFESWAASEPERTSTWLTRHPEASPFRTAAIHGMVRYLERTDPEAANAWRGELQK